MAKKMLTNDHKWPFMNKWSPMTNVGPYHDDGTIMTQSWHDQALTMSWSYDDHTITVTREGHDHNIIVMSCSFYGNAIVMLLSHHIFRVYLIVLSWPYHSCPTYMGTYMLSWSSQGHGTGMTLLGLVAIVQRMCDVVPSLWSSCVCTYSPNSTLQCAL